MITIGLTQKLAKQLNIELKDPEEYKEIPEIKKWHANLITVNRRKCLIIMNNETGINLSLFGLRKQQFDNLENVFKGSLKQLLQLVKVEEDIIKEMLQATDQIVYTTTDNRRILGMMNEVKKVVEDSVEGLSYEEIDAAEINYICNVELIYGPLNANTPVDVLRNYFD
ncbi:hypothetical protein [Halobacillus sp. Marseille-Q1614]|uniref:DUF6933 domain-containing protein n=1 Tax=Halobacillus sp. Marseille-Q1614 TaxID=2709134 RepID=UPI0015703B85|nr:hypothetical protein [Halobacillus sp. Marseille-Q1614]